MLTTGLTHCLKCAWSGTAEGLKHHFCMPSVVFQSIPGNEGWALPVCTGNAVTCKDCSQLWEPDFNEVCPWCKIKNSAEYEMWTSSTMVDGKSVECADPECTSTNPKAHDSSHKIPLDLCPGSAIVAIASVIAQGHKKPGREIYNWREKPISYRQYHAAVLRHLAKYLDGEEHDTELSELTKCDESGNIIEGAEGYKISHLDAAISSMAILIDARECGTLLDDRPGKGGAAKYLNRITKDPKK